MKRSLTADPTSDRLAGRARPWLPALLLGSALLLASCGGTSAPSGGTSNVGGGNSGITAPSTGTLKVTVEEPLTSGLNDPGVLRLSGVTPDAVSVSLTAPSGLTVTSQTPTASGSDTLVPLLATGSAASGSSVTVTVTAGSRTGSAQVPVTSFGVYPIVPTGAASGTYAGGPYQAAGIRAAADGTLLLRAPASGDDQQRHSLVSFNPASGAFKFLNFPVPVNLETITAHTVTPDGRVWVAVRGVTAAGSRLIALDTAGKTQDYPAGTTDTPGNLTPGADGRVWFTQYNAAHDKVTALDPASGAVTPTDVPEHAGNLVSGTDGHLYFAQYNATPAIVQMTTSGAQKAFKVGTPAVSLPTALAAAPDGTLWFIEARTGSVWHLDPASGKQTQLALPGGVRPTELAAAPGGTLWVSDATSGTLYRYAGGQTTPTVFPALKTAAGTPSGPRALTVTADGKLWYEADGKLVTMN